VVESVDLTYTGAARWRSAERPYLPEPGLVQAVNLALLLERPLLLTGAPDSGKSSLAPAIAHELGQRHGAPWPLEVWPIRSTSQARDGLYRFDGVARLRDAQLAARGTAVDVNPRRYVRLGPLGRAFTNPRRAVVLIDDIDRADIDFPNDLLIELDERKFQIIETGEWIIAQSSPIVIVTSSDDKALPPAFLRRCLFYYLEFPATGPLLEIMAARFPETDLPATEARLIG
jgi:MoxR-like ATPase